MNVDLIYQKIKAPHLLESKDIELFRTLSEKHPYSQVFSILYLKAMAVNKDLHFEEELQKTAYKITDREKLYNLIHLAENPIKNKIDVAEIISEPEIVPAAIEIIEVKLEEEIIVQELITEEIVEDIVDEVIEETIKEPEVLEEVKEEKIEFIQEEIPATKIESEEENAALEKEFLSNIVANSYSLEHLESKIEAKEENKIIPTIIPEATDLEISRSFTSWLHANSSSTNDFGIKKATQPIETLISEKIIEEKPKTEFYSASKKAKESVNEEKLLYSETLANIFALQGNYPKAIKAFQHLSLTIPEKKLYFAQKIEELSKKIN
jgi:hypothetical protein